MISRGVSAACVYKPKGIYIENNKAMLARTMQSVFGQQPKFAEKLLSLQDISVQYLPH